MQAIILAAGKGSRLAAESNGLPKPMVMVGAQSIIHYQIKTCLQKGIKRFVIVVGYQKEILISHILELLLPSQVSFIENPIYDKTNTLYSLYLASQFLKQDSLYFNADVMFEPGLLDQLLDCKLSSILVEQKDDCEIEEVKVKMDQDHFLKEIGKTLPLSVSDGEFIGIACFRLDILHFLLQSLKSGIEAGEHNHFFELAVNRLCQKKPIKCILTNGLPCLEIDFPEDLMQARLIFGK